MTLCANCGRPRDGDARFCGTCGTEYSDSPPPVSLDPAHEAPVGDVTRIDRPADRTDPFASWYRPQEQAGVVGDDHDEHWQPTETVRSGPAQPGYSPPLPPAGPSAQSFPQAQSYPQAQPYASVPPRPPVPPRGGRDRRGRRGLFIVLAAVVVLAAGGGAYAVANSLGGHTSGPPAAQSGGTGSAGTPSVIPSPALSLLSVAPGVTSSTAEPQVEDLISHYFQAINSRDYAEYASTLDPAERAKQSPSVFDSGYATTTDSGMTLTALTGGSDGGLTATVTFTSRQSAAQSVDKSPCNDWRLNFYLVPQGSGYLIGPAPAGYQPAYSNC